MKWPPQFWRRWKARRAHDALVLEARRDWRIVHSGKTYWSAEKPRTVACAFVCEENGLGERRVRVISSPCHGYRPTAEIYHNALLWAAKAERRSIPRKEIA